MNGKKNGGEKENTLFWPRRRGGLPCRQDHRHKVLGERNRETENKKGGKEKNKLRFFGLEDAEDYHTEGVADLSRYVCCWLVTFCLITLV